MDLEEINNILNEAVAGQKIYEIQCNKRFSLLIETTQSNDHLPSVIRINLFSDWFIPKIGSWADLDFFPFEDKTAHIKYFSRKSYFLSFLVSKVTITNINIKQSGELNILFENGWSIVLPPFSATKEDLWSIDSNDDLNYFHFRYAYNFHEGGVYEGA